MTECHTVDITCTHPNKQKKVIILWAYHGTTLSGFLPDYGTFLLLVQWSILTEAGKLGYCREYLVLDHNNAAFPFHQCCWCVTVMIIRKKVYQCYTWNSSMISYSVCSSLLDWQSFNSIGTDVPDNIYLSSLSTRCLPAFCGCLSSQSLLDTFQVA